VLLRALGAQFDRQRLGDLRENALRLGLAEWGEAESWLRSVMTREAVPSDQEVAAAFLAERDRLRQPRRWRLENIFKRWSDESEEERAQLRDQMAQIRARILAGEDFAVLAELESESQTRLRGGRLGTVSLDQLSEPVAVIVGGLKPGDVTPVIETEDGLTILRCTQLIEPTSPTLDEFAPTIAARLKGERFTAAWDRLTRDLLDRLKPSIRPAAVTAAAAPDTVVATVRGEQGPHPILLDDYQVFLASRKVRRAPWELSEEDHRQRIEERVLVEARAQEAVHRGFREDPRAMTELGWRLAELRGRIALDAAIAGAVEPPREEDVRSLYEARKDGLKEVEKLHLKVLRIAITPEHGADFYRRLAELGDRLATGATGFSDAVARLGADAELEDLGWVTRDRVWMMGKNLNHAVSVLEPGGTSPVVQEGQQLYFLHLVARQGERQMAYDEARQMLHDELLARRRLEAEEQERLRIIERQDIQLLEAPPPSAAPESER